MHKSVRELVEYAKLCGFELAGIDGGEHYVLVHPNGGRCRIPGTPSDSRGLKNARAQMRRLSGVTPPRPRAGKYRHERGTAEYVPAVERVDSMSHQVALLRKEFFSVCDRIEACRTSGDVTGAAELVSELLEIEAAFGRFKVDPPVRRFRAFW